MCCIDRLKLQSAAVVRINSSLMTASGSIADPITNRIYANRPVSPLADIPACRHSTAMLAEIYIEALLVDEELADQV